MRRWVEWWFYETHIVWQVRRNRLGAMSQQVVYVCTRISTGLPSLFGVYLELGSFCCSVCFRIDRVSDCWQQSKSGFPYYTLSLGAAIAIHDAIGSLVKLQENCSHNCFLTSRTSSVRQNRSHAGRAILRENRAFHAPGYCIAFASVRTWLHLVDYQRHLLLISKCSPCTIPESSVEHARYSSYTLTSTGTRTDDA
jgi:hypothetical protein